jgi:hypothetical protein
MWDWAVIETHKAKEINSLKLLLSVPYKEYAKEGSSVSGLPLLDAGIDIPSDDLIYSDVIHIEILWITSLAQIPCLPSNSLYAARGLTCPILWGINWEFLCQK